MITYNCKAFLDVVKILALTFILIPVTFANSGQSDDPGKTRNRDAGLSGVEKLLAIEEIKGLRLTFCRALDNYDWDKLRSTITDDYQLYFADESEAEKSTIQEPVELTGADNFIAFAKQLTGEQDESRKMIHVCTMPQVEFTSADKARALWFINGYGENAETREMGYERVEEFYERIDGKWQITKSIALIQARISIKK